MSRGDLLLAAPSDSALPSPAAITRSACGLHTGSGWHPWAGGRGAVGPWGRGTALPGLPTDAVQAMVLHPRGPLGSK